MHKAGGKVIYIPGNHDAEILMNPHLMAPINDHSINLHKNTYQLVPGLIMAGLGGSLPT